MSDISLDEIKAFAADLSPWAHLATISAAGWLASTASRHSSTDAASL